MCCVLCVWCTCTVLEVCWCCRCCGFWLGFLLEKRMVYIFKYFHNLQERPYHNDSTASRLLSEVKHCRARLVLRWGTTLESLVLFFCCFDPVTVLHPLLCPRCLPLRGCCSLLHASLVVSRVLPNSAIVLLLGQGRGRGGGW